MVTLTFKTFDEAIEYAKDSKLRGCIPVVIVWPDGVCEVRVWDTPA